MAADPRTEHQVRRGDLTLAQLAAMNVEQWRTALRSALGSPVEPDDRRSA
jgi:hypothetical protein